MRLDLDEVGSAIGYGREHTSALAAAGASREVCDQASRSGAGQLEAQLRLLRAYYDGEECGYDPEGFYRVATYNPEGQWDWWVVGGRWRESLEILPAWDGDERIGRGSPSVLDREVSHTPLRADSAPKECVDLAGMRARAGAARGEIWDKVREVTRGVRSGWTWAQLRAEVESGTISWEEARSLHQSSPRAQALRAAGLRVEEDEYLGTREEAVARGALEALPGYASVAAGQWIAPGSVGWFGMTSETSESREAYLQRVNALIDAAPAETILTVVDCHS